MRTRRKVILRRKLHFAATCIIAQGRINETKSLVVLTSVYIFLCRFPPNTSGFLEVRFFWFVFVALVCLFFNFNKSISCFPDYAFKTESAEL